MSGSTAVRRARAGVATVCLLAGGAGCARSLAPAPPDTPVALVDGRPITAGELRTLVLDELRLRGLDPSRTSSETAQAYEAQILDQRIDVLVLERAVGEPLRARVADEVDRLIRQEQARAGGEEAFVRELASRRLTPRSFRHGLYRDALLRALADAGQAEASRRRLREAAKVELRLGESTILPPKGATASPGALAFACVVVLVLASGILWLLRRGRAGWAVVGCFVAGSMLRLGLWAVTPYDIRAHDAEEHLEYVAHLVRTGSVPDSRQGFMFYQPPLYYALSALVVSGSPAEAWPRRLQTLGLVLSVGALGVSIGACHAFLRDRGATRSAPWAALLLACCPSFAFLAARVNNDSLSVLLNLAGCALLLAFWKQGGSRWWWATILVLSLSLLTKSTALVPLTAAFGCVSARPGTSWTRKLTLIATGVVVVGILCGWLWVRRAGEGQGRLVGNLGQSSARLALSDGRADFLAFDPGRLVRRPFNNVWLSGRDRDVFWEYLFRSVWFGQYSFPEVPMVLARTIVVAGLLALGFVALGFVLALRTGWQDALPLTLTLLLGLGGHVAYVVSAPLASSQDFRYSMVALLPLACFFGIGSRARPALLPRARAATAAALGGSALFFLAWLIVA